MCNGKGIGGNMYNDQCAACPDCLDCSVPGTTSLRPGWAFYGQNTAFSCLGNEDVATESCIGGELSNNTVSARAWERDGAGFSTETLESTCGLAYTGRSFLDDLTQKCSFFSPYYHLAKQAADLTT